MRANKKKNIFVCAISLTLITIFLVIFSMEDKEVENINISKNSFESKEEKNDKEIEIKLHDSYNTVTLDNSIETADNENKNVSNLESTVSNSVKINNSRVVSSNVVNNKGNSNNIANTNTTNNNNIFTPIISEYKAGYCDEEGMIYTSIYLEKIQGSIEIYYATSEDGEYKLVRKAEKPDEGNLYNISIPLGEKYYYKVRYVSNNGVYSEYSNVICYDNNQC